MSDEFFVSPRPDLTEEGRLHLQDALRRLLDKMRKRYEERETFWKSLPHEESTPSDPIQSNEELDI